MKFTDNFLFSTTERIIAAAMLFIFAVGCFVVGFFNPSNAGFFPPCMLLKLTGLACPGCGLTRGFHALFHGDVWTAIDFNAFVPVYALIFLYLSVYGFSIVLRGRGLKYNLLSPAPLLVFLIMSLSFGVLRNIPYAPFTFLYP